MSNLRAKRLLPLISANKNRQMKGTYIIPLLISILIIGLRNQSQAQSDSTHTRKKRMIGIGINYAPAHFKKSLKEVKESFELPWAYSVAYKYRYKKRIFRASINGNSYTTEGNTRTYGILYSAGIEWPIIDKRLQLKAGADLISYYNNSKSPTYKSQHYGWGIGPVISLDYDINEKLAIGTEVSLFWGIRKRIYGPNGMQRYDWEKYFGTHRAFSLHIYHRIGK